jgi:tRNA pseudouridine-54 N-methylase
LIARNFIVGFKDIPVDSDRVKSGLNSLETVIACRCINVGLFISDDIRRTVQVSLCVGLDTDLRIISFSGEKIKRVSPDERSISFFLSKAMFLLDKMDSGTVKSMDNGIVLSRTDMKNFLTSWSAERVHIADSSVDTHDWAAVSTSGIFVYDMSGALMRGLAKRPVSLLTRPTNPERFILDMNLHCDRLQMSSPKKAS